MLLKTRFYLPPLRKNCVVRASLIAQLERTEGGELILVSAPPGYGKTTLLSQWLHHSPHLFAWVGMEIAPSNPQAFWQNILNAISQVQPGIGEEAKSLIGEHCPDIARVIVSLLNDLDSLSTLNSASPLTLVLDDFHKVSNTEIFDTFNLFLDHLPSAIRVALTTRIEPPLKLARRRANAQLMEFRQNDLAFNQQEASEFFSQTMKLKLGREELFSILANIEGWAAGLQLVAMSVAETHHTPDFLKTISESNVSAERLNRDIADYLFEEAFSHQDHDLQHFLVSTACLSKFCASLANAVLQRNDSLSLLKRIDQLNLFLVPLDTHRTWFRYHDSFRQFLRMRFEELDTQDQKAIQQRARGWLDEGGYSDVLFEETFAPDPQAPLNVNTSQDQAAIDVALVEPLTKREAQVMSYLKEGYSNKEIASRLHISLNTLKVHIRNLYGKIGVENRTQALVKLSNAPSKD